MPLTISAGASCQGLTCMPARFSVSTTPSTPSVMSRVPPWSSLRPNFCSPCASPNPRIMPPDQGTIASPALSGE